MSSHKENGLASSLWDCTCKCKGGKNLATHSYTVPHTHTLTGYLIRGHGRPLKYTLSSAWKLFDTTWALWHIIMLEVGIIRCVHCGHERMHMVSNDTRTIWYLNNAWLVLRVPRKHCPHHYPITPSAWTNDTRQAGSTNLCWRCQILTLPSACCRTNQDSSDQPMFFRCSTVQLC